ncbi:hypothetical protein BDF22DRAFT_779163 [Syncephalis plumigaleata]|nr:hypothetical protein BDF22DRAFT_779163 [Syncephalis plumigaleata]
MFGFIRSNTSTSRGLTTSNSSRQSRSTDSAREGSLSGGGGVSPEALLANLNIDLSADINIEVNDEDETGLDDPDLLAQLAALSVTSDTSSIPPEKVQKARKAPSTQNTEQSNQSIDWQALDDISKTALVGSHQDDEDDEDIEVTEEDMQDPTLLAELDNIVQPNEYQSATTATATATTTIKSTIVTSSLSTDSQQQSDDAVSDTNIPAEIESSSGEPPMDIDPMADQLDILDEIEVETQRMRASRSVDEVKRGLTRMQQRVEAAHRISNTVIADAAQHAVTQLQSHLATLPSTDSNEPTAASASDEKKKKNDYTTIEQELANYLACRDVVKIEHAIKQFKIQAVQAKRAGQSESALLYLRASKQLTTHATSLTSQSVEESSMTITTATTATAANSSSSTTIEQERKLTASTTTITTSNTDVIDQESTLLDIDLLKSRLQAYKISAIESKRKGDLGQAREHLIIVKQLQSVLEQQAAGITITDFTMPPPPPPPTSSAGIKSNDNDDHDSNVSIGAELQSQSNVNSVNIASTSNTTENVMANSQPVIDYSSTTLDYQQVKSRLTEQIQLATTIASNAYRRGDKETALQFHKTKKILLTDVEWIDSLHAHRQPLPLIDYQDVSYTLETSNDDLNANELEVVIHRAWDLHGARDASPGPMDLFVQWDNGLEGGKGTSPTLTKQQEPVFDYKAKQIIQRNRTLQRHLERKKMTFDIMSYRGFLRGSVCIGRAALKLDGLLKHCTIDEIIPLMEPNSRRATGGKLQVSLRLKTPLLGADKVKHEERWLFLNHSRISAATTTASTAAKTETSKPATLTSVSKPATSSNKPSTVAAAAAAPSPSTTTTTTAQDDSQLDTLLQAFDSIDNIVSNMVLEAEQEQIQAQLQGKPANSAELRDRLQSVQIKLNMLVLQVQTGTLTLPAYIQNVRQSIEQTKRQALQFKRLNRMDKAREAMNRLKIMQQEVAEVEQAGLI